MNKAQYGSRRRGRKLVPDRRAVHPGHGRRPKPRMLAYPVFRSDRLRRRAGRQSVRGELVGRSFQDRSTTPPANRCFRRAGRREFARSARIVPSLPPDCWSLSVLDQERHRRNRRTIERCSSVPGAGGRNEIGILHPSRSDWQLPRWRRFPVFGVLNRVSAGGKFSGEPWI